MRWTRTLKRRTIVALLAVIVVSSATVTQAQAVEVDVTMTTPVAGYTEIDPGDLFSVEWVGGYGDSMPHKLQLWHGWVNGWEMLDPAISAPDSPYVWDSTGADLGSHRFSAWVDRNDGSGDWYYTESPGWVDVVGVAEEPIALTNPEEEEPPIYQGMSYDVNWTGGSADAIVQLWVGSVAGWGMLGEFAATDGSYTWDTWQRDVAPGEYTFTAWCKAGDTGQWYHITALGTLTVLEGGVTPEPATLVVLMLGGIMMSVRRRRRRA